MEYFDETLYSLNKKYLKNFSNMPPVLVKLYSYQLFRALNYLNALSNIQVMQTLRIAISNPSTSW